ncbi:flagellar biosynthetic protein FliR [Cereibacter azotoformans]|uniref:Flagellar biosynthetic protein FliR n=1 Tax=Cereibacter azotoformans TaxID=43057 RepID=A0A2T5K823_9RHOB|nr:flagellar biosynthetic protein FliR [Cereibacter azotoformans]AXQ94989.1 type III secretion protein [Cereibacter sphaeroides]MBO4170124.1 flagellar biosynthetic protein FliR [Cereibacter azotoformans]PTR18581.1 flagellar biosynthetic protein FliR [Cereibacter azotoformans]UIJ30579.1 flagellar biosynthetic protein FliR [Cereibacter azotoformans]
MTLFEQATELTLMVQDLFRAGFLVFIRVGAAMALLPAFGEMTLPARVRLTIALAFTAIVFPAVSDRVPAFDGSPVALGIEAAIGLVLGISLRLFVLALQTAGTVAAQAVSLSQMFGSPSGEPQPVIGNVLTLAGLAIAVAGGLHVRLAEFLILSYDLLPAARLPVAGDVADWGLHLIVHTFALAFMLSMPFVAASFVFNVALGIINRAMPQLMVFFVGAPALTFGGLVLLALSAPLALGLWVTRLGDFLDNPSLVAPP